MNQSGIQPLSVKRGSRYSRCPPYSGSLWVEQPGISGANMAADEDRDADTKQTDRGKKTAEQPKPAIPDSWSLTEQQKAFIDLFSGDDDEDNDKKS